MKTYVKPELFYENFQLSHTIANCSPATNHKKEDCALEPDEAPGLGLEGSLFTNTDLCTYDPESNPGLLEILCYFTGSGDYHIFTS